MTTTLLYTYASSEIGWAARQAQHIVIGSEAENPAILTGCEWWDVFLDQQFQVRMGSRRNGYWHLEVARSGSYRFTLRRWPSESGLTLAQACAATTVTDGAMTEGHALPIAGARICVGDHDRRTEVSGEDHAAEFTLELAAGRTLLHTWFTDQRKEPICGAYYVEVERLG